jgi:hypothetical protein
VAKVIEYSGDIETFSLADEVKVGDRVLLVFRADESADPPFNIRIREPDGRVILERVLRELPTGKPQSAPPVQFNTTAEGEYKIEIWQLYGKDRGEATLRVVPNPDGPPQSSSG